MKEEYVQRLANQAHDTVDLLSSRRKGERERLVCAAFLRCLGLDFSSEEIAIPENDPPDVVFREAWFEVRIVLDEGRKMHADWKNEAKRRDIARTLDNLAEPYQPSIPMSVGEMVDLISTELSQKASHYGKKTCSELDALAYINLRRRHLYPISDVEVPSQLRSQGWRSVCFVFPPYSSVVYAGSEAPDMLRQFDRQVRHQCQNPDAIFEL